jgi:hypothetical protein
MARRGPDRLLVVLGALSGAVLGSVYVLAVQEPDDWQPVQTVVTYSNKPGSSATLDVVLLEKWSYKRTAPDPKEFDTEVAALGLAYPAALVLTAGCLGALAMILAAWVARRIRNSGGIAPEPRSGGSG